MATRKLILTLTVVCAMGALLVAQTQPAPKTGLAMAEAARGFLVAISPEQVKAATFKYDDPERLNWHFIPRERKGVPLKSLEGAPLQAAQKLIRSGLSEAGYDQALNVMSLEEVLYLIEPGERAARRDRRDPGKYYISIFGEPADAGMWGWRLEGHHLCLNFSDPVGLPVSKMSDDQKKLLQDLLGEYLKNLPADIEEDRRRTLNSAGLDKITFAWYGQPDLHQAHHYRVQGPTFVIEYNNTQNNANHVHSMWRNLTGDFALPK